MKSYFAGGGRTTGNGCMALSVENWRKSYNKPPEGRRLPDCPLVPLPEGHGRLGDLDVLQEEFKKSHNGKRLMLIDTAPTIVPAEGGEADGN